MRKTLSILFAVIMIAVMSVGASAATEDELLAYRSSYTIVDETLVVDNVWQGNVNLDTQMFGDATYEFDMNINEANEWAGFMICKISPDHIWDHSGYLFHINASGSWRFYQCSAGAQGIAEGAIEGFENVMNHYKLVKNGSHIELYVNDTKIVDLEDDNFEEGYFSFVTCGNNGNNMKVIYDNLEIKGADGTSYTNYFGSAPADETAPDDTETPDTDEPENAPQTGFATAIIAAAAILSGAYIIGKKR